MASINLTQLLGTDNIALSRPTINQNFTTVQNAINTLEQYLNTTPAGASLGVGNVQINLGANNVNSTLFTCAASGIFQGNLTINQALTVTGTTSFVNDITAVNGLSLLGTGPSPALNIGQTGHPVSIYHRGGMFVDEQYATEGDTAAHIETVASSGVFDLPISGKRVVYLDYSLYTAGAPNADTLQFVGTPVVGQRLFIRISKAPVGGGTFKIETTGIFKPEYSADIVFTGASDAVLKKLWVEVLYTSTGWTVVNSHPLVTGI